MGITSDDVAKCQYSGINPKKSELCRFKLISGLVLCHKFYMADKMLSLLICLYIQKCMYSMSFMAQIRCTENMTSWTTISWLRSLIIWEHQLRKCYGLFCSHGSCCNRSGQWFTTINQTFINTCSCRQIQASQFEHIQTSDKQCQTRSMSHCQWPIQDLKVSSLFLSWNCQLFNNEET